MAELQRVEIHGEPTGSEAPAQVPVTPAVKPGQPEVTIPETPTERPAWLPSKFKSAEEMASAYAQLETKLGAPPAKEGEAGKKPDAPTEILSDEEMSVFSREVISQGELSPESYTALEAKGFPRVLVDQYVEGLQAVTAQKLTSVFDAVGGKDTYQAMTEWAQANLSQDEIQAYNSTVESGNVQTALLAVRGLHATFVQKRGSAPVLLKGKAGDATSTQPFRSTAEMVKAMQDPRYAKDPAYRADVERRLERANIF